MQPLQMAHEEGKCTQHVRRASRRHTQCVFRKKHSRQTKCCLFTSINLRRGTFNGTYPRTNQQLIKVAHIAIHRLQCFPGWQRVCQFYPLLPCRALSDQVFLETPKGSPLCPDEEACLCFFIHSCSVWARCQCLAPVPHTTERTLFFFFLMVSPQSAVKQEAGGAAVDQPCFVQEAPGRTPQESACGDPHLH